MSALSANKSYLKRGSPHSFQHRLYFFKPHLSTQPGYQFVHPLTTMLLHHSQLFTQGEKRSLHIQNSGSSLVPAPLLPPDSSLAAPCPLCIAFPCHTSDNSALAPVVGSLDPPPAFAAFLAPTAGAVSGSHLPSGSGSGDPFSHSTPSFHQSLLSPSLPVHAVSLLCCLSSFASSSGISIYFCRVS